MGILPVLAIFAIWSIGNQITGTQYTVYKVQAKNSDAQVDKSGGYRLIDRVESPNQVVLHLIYAKSEQANVSAEEIQTAIAEYQVDPDNWQLTVSNQNFWNMC